MAKKTYVLDTNVYLTDGHSIKTFGNNDILIPFKVLEEIDKHKKRQDSVGLNARIIIRTLDELRSKGNLKKGVRIGKGKGIVFARPHDLKLLPNELDKDDADNTIISTALAEKTENPNKKVIVVTRDINMRVRCDAIGLPSEDFQAQQTIADSQYLYSGFAEHLVDEQIIDQFYADEEIEVSEEDIKLHTNQLVMLVSNSNNKKTAIAKFTRYEEPLKKIMNYDGGVWGVRPRNKEQAYALDILTDPEIQVVTLVGKAGSGKTLCAIAAGLEQALEQSDEGRGNYKRIIVSRPIQPMGKDIGYLPGSMEEKMAPWLAPIQDNLEFLMGNKKTLDMYIDDGIVEVEALTYIRGRSIANAFIVIDEAQQLTKHEIKTILTRIGEGTKIVFTGDIEQIDNVYVDETSNGLTYVVEKFKDQEFSGHIILQKGERSKVATVAAKIL